MAKTWQVCPGSVTGLGLCRAFLWEREDVSLTVLYLGAELALFGILKNRVVAGVCALHSTVAAGLVKEGTVATWGCAAIQGHLLKPTCADISLQFPGAQEQLDVGDTRVFSEAYYRLPEWVEAHVSHSTLGRGPQTESSMAHRTSSDLRTRRAFRHPALEAWQGWLWWPQRLYRPDIEMERHGLFYLELFSSLSRLKYTILRSLGVVLH